jgi:hypothetical protein
MPSPERILQQARSSFGAGEPMMSDKDKLYMAAAGIPVGAGAYYGSLSLAMSSVIWQIDLWRRGSCPQ